MSRATPVRGLPEEDSHFTGVAQQLEKKEKGEGRKRGRKKGKRRKKGGKGERRGGGQKEEKRKRNGYSPGQIIEFNSELNRNFFNQFSNLCIKTYLVE